MAKLKIRKKDAVMVMAGKDRGKKGEVLRVLPAEGERPPRVVVSKVNLLTSHVRPKPTEPGGIQKKEGPIAISSVMLLCPKCQKPIRPRLDKLPSGERVRACRKCGEVIL